MKEKIVRFTCDYCGTEITTREEDGYPYSKGWCYIYNFSFKILYNNDVVDEVDGEIVTSYTTPKISQEEEKDKHFCGDVCMKKFLNDKINDAKGNQSGIHK